MHFLFGADHHRCCTHKIITEKTKKAVRSLPLLMLLIAWFTQLKVFYKAFKRGFRPPVWPVRLSSCSYSLYNFTCPSPSCLLSYKNTAFFTTWRWHSQKKRGWRTLSVISYRPLFSSPVFLPSCEARWKLVKWVMTEDTWLLCQRCSDHRRSCCWHQQECNDITSHAANECNLLGLLWGFAPDRRIALSEQFSRSSPQKTFRGDKRKGGLRIHILAF